MSSPGGGLSSEGLSSEQEYEKEKLNERIARLSGGVAIIQVCVGGGGTPGGGVRQSSSMRRRR